MKKRLSLARFTLVELLCVCGILILLMGIGIGVYSVANRKMGESKCRAMIAKLSTALQNYYSKQGYYIQASTVSYFYVDKYTYKDDGTPQHLPSYPDDNDDTITAGRIAWSYTLNTEIAIPSNELNTKPHSGVLPAEDILKYSRGAWKDPFGNKFMYQCPGKHNPTSFDLYSYGADQSSGTTAGDTGDDLTNWTQ